MPFLLAAARRALISSCPYKEGATLLGFFLQRPYVSNEAVNLLFAHAGVQKGVRIFFVSCASGNRVEHVSVRHFDVRVVA